MEHEADAVRDEKRGDSSSEQSRCAIAEDLRSVNSLLDEETTQHKPKTSGSLQWRSLFAFTSRRHTVLSIFAVLAAIASGVIDPITTIFIGKVYQAFTDFGGATIQSTELKSKVTLNTLILAGLGTADWIFNAIFLFLWVLFGELQARSVRTQLFDGLLGKPVTFYDTLPSGVEALTPKLQMHIRELQLATSQPFGYILSATTGAVASFVIAIRFEWSLTLILLSTMPINAFVVGFMSSRMGRNTQKQAEQLADAAKNAANAFAAIDTVKTFNGQGCELNKFALSIQKAAGYYIRLVHGNAIEIGYMKCMTLLTFMIGFWYGSHLVISGQRTTADIITTFYSCMELTASIQGILPQMIVLEKGRISGDVLSGYVGPVNCDSDLGDGKRPLKCDGAITILDVTFAYPCRPDHPVLKNVTCSFAAGKTAFVIGRSGSGKSSLAQLLMKFYQPDSGQILLDGHPLDDINSLWLRKNIALVEQQSVLFDGTIFENIAAGSRDMEKVAVDDVEAAAEFALLLNTIRGLQDGFETKIGLKGHCLSGGQRQRIAIARARIRDTPILILDESTSALDAMSRSMIVSAIRRWRRNKTTIFITHDISLIDRDDLVYVFEDGCIVKTGYRSALSASPSNGFFLFTEISDEVKRGNAIINQEYAVSPEPSHLSLKTGQDLPYKSGSGDKLPSRRNRGSLLDIIPPIYRDINMFDPGILSPRGVSDPTPAFLRPRPQIVEFSALPLASLSERARPSLDSNSLPPPVYSANMWTGNNLASPEIEMDLLESTGESAIEKRRKGMSLREWRARVPVERLNSSETSNSSSHRADRKWRSRGSQDLTSELSLWEILWTVWPTVDKRTRRTLLGAFSCTLIHAISIPLFSWIFSRLLSTFYIKFGATEAALKWSLSVLGLSIVDGAACYGMHIQFEYSAQVWIDCIRLEAMKRILDQPREFFADERNSPSQLAYSLNRNAEEMRNILGRFLPFVSIAIVMMVVAISWSLVVCWKLTLVGLTLTPISWGMTRLYQVITERLEGRTNDAGESAAALLNDAFTNIKTVRGLTLEASFRKKYTKACSTAFNIGLKRALYCGFFYGISQAIMVFNNSLIYYYGAVLVSSGAYSVQDMLLVFSQLLFALGNTTTIVAIIPQVSSSKDTASRLMKLANLPQDSHEKSGKIIPLGVWDIALTDLRFSYSNRVGDLVLQHINLNFTRGTTTALVGTSGSGKSTIASLLLKMYPLTRDEDGKTPMLSINGRDIRSICTPALRNLITAVAQIPVLLPGTVEENIAYGLDADSPARSIEAVRAAAAAAGIDDFLMSLPDGYDTIIGDGGIGLSGGQAQRVAVARALVRKPTVLILDEATSALDGESAKMIHETIKALIRENPSMTVIIITHSRDMMLLADRIVVLDRGQIVDEGTYDELAKRQGKFLDPMDR